MHKLAYILLVIGGLNWGIFGITGWDVGQLFGDDMRNTIAMIIYILVGIAAIVEVLTHKNRCKNCDAGSGSSMPSSPTA